MEDRGTSAGAMTVDTKSSTTGHMHTASHLILENPSITSTSNDNGHMNDANIERCLPRDCVYKFSPVCFFDTLCNYSFRMLISDNTETLTLTCFRDEAHSMVTECNKVVSEQGFIDPCTLPPVVTTLEGTTHLFQLHYSTDSTK